MEGIIFDIDSTLFSHKENRIPEQTISALEKLREIDFPRAICTSRFSFELKNLPKELFTYFDLMIFGSGNEIMYRNEFTRVSELDPEIIESYMDYFRKNDIQYRFTTIEHKMVYSENSDRKLVNEIAEMIDVEPSFGEYNGERLISLAYFSVDEQQMKELESISDEVSIVDFECSGQVCAKGVNKAVSVETMSELYGLEESSIIAVGDGLNDIDMIKRAGVGVAVGNAHPQLMDNADYVGEPIENGGIYSICRHFNIF